MKEKIKQLAELAAKDNSDGYNVTLEYTDKFAEKLAELIIQECAKCCSDYSHQILKFSQFGSNAARDCADIISTHFEDAK